MIRGFGRRVDRGIGGFASRVGSVIGVCDMIGTPPLATAVDFTHHVFVAKMCLQLSGVVVHTLTP